MQYTSNQPHEKNQYGGERGELKRASPTT